MRDQKNNAANVRLWCVIMCIFLLYALTWLLHYSPPLLFGLSVIAVYLAAPPSYLFSARNMLTAFYLMFYSFPVGLASRYDDFTFTRESQILAYILLITTFITAYVSSAYGESVLENQSGAINNILPSKIRYYDRDTAYLIAKLGGYGGAALSSIIGGIIIASSGGIGHWIENPGQAFLRREGLGVFSVMLIFFSAISSLLLGYLWRATGKKRHLIFSIGMILLLSPVLGSKSRLFMNVTFTLIPIFINLKTRVKYVTILCSIFILAFSLTTWFRNSNWMTSEDALPYILNYFSTFEMLVMSLEEFKPAFSTIFLLPFNKLYTPVGISSEQVFYDMSAWLTSIYFPESWAIRATEQWPIETDLYLSFEFIWGLPIIILYYLGIGRLFVSAVASPSLGIIFCYIYLVIELISRMRGGVIIWTDLYVMPFLIISYLLFHKLPAGSDYSLPSFFPNTTYSRDQATQAIL